ncbi:PASTA domain-containing protein [Promicromonospora sp. Marseille-Q5078]
MRSPKDSDPGAPGDAAERTSRRGARALRVLATATASCVLAGGFLLAPVAGLPWNAAGFDSAADQDTPVVGAGSPAGEGVTVGVVGTSTSGGPTTVREVLGVLERAELAAKDAGRTVTPEVDQAAAELGMLLSTYLAQEAAASADRPFAAAGYEAPAPVAPAPADETEPVDEADVQPVAHRVVTDPATDPGAEATDDGVVSAGLADSPEPEDGAEPEDGHEDGHDDGHDAEPVTFDDVVVAATRLATLLDPATTTLEAGILPAGTAGTAGTVAARATLTASLLEVVDRYGRSTAGYANGRIPASALCPLEFAPGHMLRCDAAEQLTALSAEYEKEFGVPIPMTDSYRPLDVQVRLKATKGYLAATPGTSNHGWGLAVDLSTPISGGTSAEYVWMRVHAPDYGWDNPSWARLTGAKPEPWHFEFFAAGPIPDRAWKATDVAASGGASGGGAGPAAVAERTGKGDGKSAGKSGTAKDGKTSTSGETSTSGKAGKDKGDDGKGTGKDQGTNPGTGGGTPDKPDRPEPETPAKAKVTVPDVTGRDLASATKKLQGLGLKVSTTVQDSTKPKDQVLRTTGAGTKVAQGSTVALVVSSGPPEQVEVEVPDVVGTDEGAAQQVVKDAGLDPEVVEQASSEVPAGVVLATDPGAGTSVEAGSAVTLVVSSGPEQVEVPDVGDDLEAAQQILADSGLDWTVSEETSDEVPAGVVLATDPGAGTSLAAGSTVTIFVSTGPGTGDGTGDGSGDGKKADEKATDPEDAG